MNREVSCKWFLRLWRIVSLLGDFDHCCGWLLWGWSAFLNQGRCQIEFGFALTAKSLARPTIGDGHTLPWPCQLKQFMVMFPNLLSVCTFCMSHFRHSCWTQKIIYLSLSYLFFLFAKSIDHLSTKVCHPINLWKYVEPFMVRFQSLTLFTTLFYFYGLQFLSDSESHLNCCRL